MKHFLLILFLIPFSIYATEKSDSILSSQNQKIENNLETINDIENEITILNKKQNAQDNLHEKTLNGISSQISAASYNLTIFGILFAIAALILGIYVTRIENKIVRIKEENQTLLNQTIKNKEEVVAINNLIQKDIHGLHLKLKREETVQLLERLSKIPEDIVNLLELLLSRELVKDDFFILKKAYLEIRKHPEQRAAFNPKPTNIDSYKLLFFQHFLGLSIVDEDISNDMSDFYSIGMQSAFENDIIKSTKDFIKEIVKIGCETKQKDINNFISSLSNSKYKDLKILYQNIFDGLVNKTNQFKFYETLSNDKQSRLGKINYGTVLLNTYSASELTDLEQKTITSINKLADEIKKEEEKQIAAQKRKKAAAEKKKQENSKKTATTKK